MTTEMRAKPRFDDKNIVGIKIRRGPGTADLSQHTLFCFTRDISAGGLSFTAHYPPAVGTKLHISVSFAAPLRTAKGLVGRVAWVQRVPNGTQHVVGVDMSETDLENMETWKKLVAERVNSK